MKRIGCCENGGWGLPECITPFVAWHISHQLHVEGGTRFCTKRTHRASTLHFTLAIFSFAHSIRPPTIFLAPNFSFIAMENGAPSTEGKDPSGFLSQIIGNPVTVKLNSGVVYKGE